MQQTRYINLTVGELLKRYGELIFGRRKDTTEVIQRCFVGLALLLDVPVSELDGRRIAAWREHRQVDREVSTIINYTALLRQILAFAWGFDFLAQISPAELPTLPPSPPRQFLKLTSEDHCAILHELNVRTEALRRRRDQGNANLALRHRPALPDLRQQVFVDHLLVIYLFLREVGAGYGLAVRVPWSDVDLDEKEWTQTSRDGTRWRLPLSDLAWETLGQWRQQCPGNALVFPGQNPDGQPLSIESAWLHLLRHGGLPIVTLENLRRDFIKRIAEQGATSQQQFYLTGRYPRRVFGKPGPALEIEQLRQIVNKASRALLQN
ncbi:hypothetical protein LMG31506_00006 [Cupriavidus yeoncheonensis]|uniref:Site-specific integrase n=1 Tax=Cupriavidus yeoncheonensis TaxID=1462994 RepID=A0A916NBR1_9BURK|nr:hypothetical protein [Cupriavidus yeoncheonensis]CAG2126522.1 hypothetical protein LMG31506_00006 [Cupriavidus yeoncheonensis]